MIETGVRRWLARWYAVVAVLLVGLLAIGYVMTRPPIYEAHGTVTLLVPADRRSPNIFRGFSSSLIETAGLLARNAADGQTRAEIANQHLGPYTAVLTNRGNQWQAIYDAPTVDIVARDHDPGRAQRTFAAVAEHMTRTLVRWQEERRVPPSTQIGTALTGATTDAVPLSIKRKRSLGAVLILTMGAEFFALRRARSWMRRRRGAPSLVSTAELVAVRLS